MILIIDNYDSFTYNLVQYLGELGADVAVVRNDRTTTQEIATIGPDKIVISPGPGKPRDAGISVAIVKEFARTIPILGVCLGHQAIAVAFGGKIVEAKLPVHGKVSEVTHDGKTIFRGVKSPLTATRYHSLVVERRGFPRSLEVSAETDDGLVMGLRHRKYPVEGVQFHPESIMTGDGKALLANFLKLGTPTKLTPGKAKVSILNEHTLADPVKPPVPARTPKRVVRAKK